MKNSKIVVLVLAAVLVFGCAVGGTLAWLMDETDKVVNTFTAGDVDISLTETGTTHDAENSVYTKQYKMVPGETLSKDPKVTVEAGSEACWVFIKVEDNAASTYLDFTVDSAHWTALDGVSGVWYAKVDDASEAVELNVLTNDQVTVKSTVTKADLDELAAEGATLPTLEFTAYAIQQSMVSESDASVAWNTIFPAAAEETPAE